MTCKYPLIAGAVVAALAVCGTASAAASFINPSAIPAQNRFYMSGSTALDNGIKDLLTLSNAAGGICTNSTMDVYYDNTSLLNSSTHQYAVTCTLRIALTDGAGHTVAAGQNVAFFKDGAGGSFEGTKPEADQSTRTYLDIFSGSFNCLNNGVPLGTNNPNGGLYFGHEMAAASAQEHASCTPSDTSATPQIGLADVNDDMFTAQAGYPGLSPLTGTELGKLTGHAVYQQEFGIAVSLNLYRVLQAAQGKTVGSDLAVDQPSLSKVMIASIAAGLISDWTQVLDPSGTNPITAAAYLTAGKSTAPGTLNSGNPLAGTGADTSAASSVTSIFWCRRGDQSGTEASANSYLLNNQCGAGGVSGASSPAAMNTNTTTPATAAACNSIAGGVVDENGCKWQNGAGAVPGSHLNDVNIGATVFPGNGTGDVDSCLNAHDYTDSYAIGVLSGDRQYDDTSVSPAGHPTWGYGGSGDTSLTASAANTSHRWRYIAIDDKKPNLESAASGTYDFMEDNELYWNPNAIAALPAANSNAYDAALGFIQTSLATATVVGDIETPQAHGTTGGILDPLAANGSTPNAIPLTVAINTNPVSGITRQASGGVQDCGTAVITTPALLGTGGALAVPSATGYQDGKTAGKGVPAPN